MTLPRYRRPNNGNINSLPKDENGKVKGGPGRGKGTKDKFSREAKHVFNLAFLGIGGLPRLIEWAESSPSNLETFFFLYSKLVPAQSREMQRDARADAADIARAFDGLRAQREYEQEGLRAREVRKLRRTNGEYYRRDSIEAKRCKRYLFLTVGN